MTLFTSLTVFTFLTATQIVVQTGNKDIREECWEEYTAVKLCFPLYDECIISMEGDCSMKFEICTKRDFRGVSNYCQQFLSSINEQVKMNEVYYPQELLIRSIGSNTQLSLKKMCNVSVFQHHALYIRNISKLAMPVMSKLPSMISTYCQCPQKHLNKDSSSDLIVQSSKSSTPIHFWLGGLKNYQCWKEVDRHLAEFLCGQSSSHLINHEWARRSDCMEDPYRINCTITFINALEKVSKNSEKPLFCSVYVEIIQKSIIFFDCVSFDYKIEYVKENYSADINTIRYQNEILYLLHHSNYDISFKCFPIKRTLHSCKYMYNHCHSNDISNDKCRNSLINCFEENQEFVPECISAIIQRQSLLHIVYGFLSFVWEHKKTALGIIGIMVLYAFGKKIRNWILKRLAIIAIASLTKLFLNATEYSESLLNTKNEMSVRSETVITIFDENSSNDISNETSNDSNEGPLLPVNDEQTPILEESPRSPADLVPEIQLEPEPQNNQRERVSSNEPNTENGTGNCQEKEEKLKKNKDKDISFTVMLASFWRMICSYSKVANNFFFTPTYNRVRRQLFQCFCSQSK